MNRTLQDPERNASLVGTDNAIPLGAVLLHEQAHILAIGGEKESRFFVGFLPCFSITILTLLTIVLDICVPGYGSGMYALKSYSFDSEVLLWLDSGLAIHNAHNYAAFAMEVAETVFSGKMPVARIDPAEIERHQEKIDGMLQYLKSTGALKPIMVPTMAPLNERPSFQARRNMKLGSDSCAAST